MNEEEEQNPRNNLFINPLEGYNEHRQQAIDTGAQFVDKVVTGGLEKINMPGSEFIGDRARNVAGFTADMLIPEDWEIPVMGAAMAADGPLPIGDALAGLKYGQGVGSRIYRAGVKAAKTGQLDTVAKNASAIVEDAFSKANSLFNRGQPGWRVATDGPPVDTSMLMSKSDKPPGWNQIPPENRDYTKPLREADKLARVNKAKIRKYVQEFGGNEDDVTRIFNEHALKQKNINQSRTWLNSYFKKLNEGLGPDGLKNARIKDIDGVPTLVDGATDKAIPHAFEVDHSKAKALMAELGLEGADFHENLDIVYTVFNRAKSDLGAIPDDILRATGQSTSLRELVQRSLDTEFDAKFTRVPDRLRAVARQRILEDVLASTPIKGNLGKIRKQIIEKHLKFWDKNGDMIVQIDDYVPEEILKDVDFFADPQQGYESLLNMGVLDSLKPALKNRFKRVTDQWVKLNRGSTAVRDYLERTGGRQIKKKYNK